MDLRSERYRKEVESVSQLADAILTTMGGVVVFTCYRAPEGYCAIGIWLASDTPMETAWVMG